MFLVALLLSGRKQEGRSAVLKALLNTRGSWHPPRHMENLTPSKWG